MVTNVDGTFLLSCAAARKMIAQGEGGSIVNISSIASKLANAKAAAYSASKAAVNALSRSMALDLAPHGIRVNAICPGIIDTFRLDDLGRGESWEKFVKSLFRWATRATELSAPNWLFPGHRSRQMDNRPGDQHRRRHGMGQLMSSDIVLYDSQRRVATITLNRRTSSTRSPTRWSASCATPHPFRGERGSCRGPDRRGRRAFYRRRRSPRSAATTRSCGMMPGVGVPLTKPTIAAVAEHCVGGGCAWSSLHAGGGGRQR